MPSRWPSGSGLYLLLWIGQRPILKFSSKTGMSSFLKMSCWVCSSDHFNGQQRARAVHKPGVHNSYTHIVLSVTPWQKAGFLAAAPLSGQTSGHSTLALTMERMFTLVGRKRKGSAYCWCLCLTSSMGCRTGLELDSVKHWHAKFLENVTLVLFDSSDLPNNVWGTKDYIPHAFPPINSSSCLLNCAFTRTHR